MSKRRKLKSRIQARMDKTEESYSIARMHITKSFSEEFQAPQAPQSAQVEPPSGRIRFNIHVALAGLEANPETEESHAERRQKALKEVLVQLRRLDEDRGGETSKTLEGLEIHQLVQLARSLATLPTNHFRLLRDAADRLRAWNRQVPAVVREMQQVMSSPTIMAVRRALQAQEEAGRVALQQLQDSGIQEALRMLPDDPTREAISSVGRDLGRAPEMALVLEAAPISDMLKTARSRLEEQPLIETFRRRPYDHYMQRLSW